VDPREEERVVKGKPALESARRGFTLIETLVVVTGAAMMLGVCALTIGLLVRLNASSQDRYTAAVALDRLGRQLRADVHGCELAEIISAGAGPEKTAGLRLRVASEHVVSYEPRAGLVVRSESKAGKPVRHESYSLPRGRVARFENRDLGSLRLVALVLSQLPGRSGTDPARPLEVVALPGKYRSGAYRGRGGQP
jgi:hypothetical protein